MERLQKYISRCGAASRRHAEAMILAGQVSVNDVVIKEMGYKIEEGQDQVKVAGKLIRPSQEFVYLALNKPKGVVSTCFDPQGRTTVLDILPPKYKVYPVGRLDYQTEGLLLLTNDGSFANQLMHPRYKIAKTYQVAVRGSLSRQAIELLRNGVDLEDGKTLPAVLELLDTNAQSSSFLLTIREGRNRQIRRMCMKVGYPVQSLQRIQVGPVKLGSLKPGSYRHLRPDEIKKIRACFK